MGLALMGVLLSGRAILPRLEEPEEAPAGPGLLGGHGDEPEEERPVDIPAGVGLAAEQGIEGHEAPLLRRLALEQLPEDPKVGGVLLVVPAREEEEGGSLARRRGGLDVEEREEPG